MPSASLCHSQIGSIPSAIGCLSGLTALDFSSNKLIGIIADKCYCVPNDYLLLHILGSIPSTLGLLTSLITLYLNANSLNGNYCNDLCTFVKCVIIMVKARLLILSDL